MTAAELIRALRMLDQSAEVFFRDDSDPEEPEGDHDGSAWLGTVERVECDSDGFIILCGEQCADEEDDDAGDDDEEEDEVEP